MPTLEERLQSAGPKRILALDGGGLRGIVSLVYLKRIESLLRERYGRPKLLLADYFDLIAGTSTGAIIAAGLCIGMSVDELIAEYRALGTRVFRKSYLRRGLVRAKYDETALVQELKRVFGTRSIGDPSIRTGLLVVSKRLDTGSPWPIGNNPQGKYFRAPPGQLWIDNADYPLWQVVRASTAAPTFFEPERITIAEKAGMTPQVGVFVDGGVSPHNNPSLQALMYATLEGYCLKWHTGPEKLLLVSVGTGRGDAGRAHGRISALGAIQALQSLMDDCADLNETLLQWLTRPLTRRTIDREIGNMGGDQIASPLAAYVRYQLDLSAEEVRKFDPRLTPKTVQRLSEMDDPRNLEILARFAAATSDQIQPEHFPADFDVK
jgi:hypothetical protein